MRTITALLILSFSVFSFAGTNKALVYSGRIINPAGEPLQATVVQFTIGIYTPGPEACVLYSETQNLNMTGSLGAFSLRIGEGNRTAGYLASQMEVVFQNDSTFTGLTCGNGDTTYDPKANVNNTDRILRISFNDGSGSGTINLAAQNIKSVPYALQARNASTAVDVTGTANISSLIVRNALSRQINITAPTAAFTNYSLVLPDSNGDVGDILTTDGNGVLSWMPAAAVGSGTVTSVGVVVPAYMTSAGGPVATAGDITLSFNNQGAGTIFAAPSGVAGAPSFRALTGTDIPDLSGTYLRPGDVIATTPLTWTAATKTMAIDLTNIQHRVTGTCAAGSSIRTINADGTVVCETDDNSAPGDAGYTAANKGIVAFDGDAATSGITVAAGVARLADTITAGTAGSATQVPVITYDKFGRLTTVTASTIVGGGDVSGDVNNLTVNKIRGKDVTGALGADSILWYDQSADDFTATALPTCAADHYLTFNGTAWSCVADAGASGIPNIIISAADPHNTFMGVDAGATLPATGNPAWDATSRYNTGIGNKSLDSLTTGGTNTSVGGLSMAFTTTGSSNTAFGYYSLAANASGYGNTSLGAETLSSSTTGVENVAIGHTALFNLTTGSHNVAIGTKALYGTANTATDSSTAVGTQALFISNPGQYYSNDAFGAAALSNLTTGFDNTAIGRSSLSSTVSGNNNVAIGRDTGINAAGSSTGNIFIGAFAGPTVSAAIDNKLYIHNSASNSPLIGGDFGTRVVNISGSLNIDYLGGYLNYQPNGTACGNNQVLKWDNGNNRWMCGDDNAGAGAFSGTPSRVVVTNSGGDLTTADLTNGQLLIGNANSFTAGSISGTANQITVTNGAGTIGLSLPQDIHSAATPTFATPSAAGHAVIKSYADGKLAGFNIAAPTVGQNTQSLRWNNGTTSWEYYTAGSSVPTCAIDQMPIHTGAAWTCIDASSNTGNSTIVRRNSDGDFFARDIGVRNIASTGSLSFRDGTTDTATIQAPADITTSYTLKLPAALPGSTMFLQSNTSGDLSWAAAGGMGGTGTTNKIPRFTAASTIGDSAFEMSGTGILNFTGANPAISFGGSSVLHNRGVSSVAVGAGATYTGFNDANTLQNTAIGFNSMYEGYKIEDNVAVGYRSMYKAGGDGGHWATGNSALGSWAMDTLNGSGAHNNTAIGGGTSTNNGVLTRLTTGANNTALGFGAGAFANTTSSGNVLLGYQAGPTVATVISNKLYIDNSANNTPLIGGDFTANTVDINGSLNIDFTGAYLNYQPNGAACSNDQVLKWDNSNSHWICGDDQGSANAFVQNGNSFGAPAVLGTNESQPLHFETDSATRMSILANGNVGVGISPSSKFHVNTTASGDGIKATDTSNAISLQPRNGAWGNSPVIDIQNGETNGKRAFISTNTNGLNILNDGASSSIIFGQNGGPTYMKILPNGDVGIGNSNPLARLDVEGTVRISATGAYLNYKPNNTECGNDQVLKWDAPNDHWICGDAGSAYTFTAPLSESAGTVTLGTVDVTKGGTGATSFAGNKIIGTNGSGSAFIALTCTDGQLLKFNSMGAAVCVDSTSANVAGTLVARGPAGEINTGSIRATGQITSAVHDAGANTAINWDQGNVQYTSANCGVFTFSNMLNGGTYTLVVNGTVSGTCTFSQTLPDSLPAVNFKFAPTNGPTTDGTVTSYTFIRVGNQILVSWITGFN